MSTMIKKKFIVHFLIPLLFWGGAVFGTYWLAKTMQIGEIDTRALAWVLSDYGIRISKLEADMKEAVKQAETYQDLVDQIKVNVSGHG